METSHQYEFAHDTACGQNLTKSVLRSSAPDQGSVPCVSACDVVHHMHRTNKSSVQLRMFVHNLYVQCGEEVL